MPSHPYCRFINFRVHFNRSNTVFTDSQNRFQYILSPIKTTNRTIPNSYKHPHSFPPPASTMAPITTTLVEPAFAQARNHLLVRSIPQSASSTPFRSDFSQAGNNLLPRSIPQAGPAPPAPAASTSSNDGWSPLAIIGIVAAIVIILVLVPLIAIILRRYERKRCLEMLPDGASAEMASSKSSVREDQSLKSILVTKEVLRSSLRMSPTVSKPEEAHTHGRGWSQTEVRGGDWR